MYKADGWLGTHIDGLTMSLLRYFQRQPSLSTPQQTGMGEQANKEANAVIEKEISTNFAGTMA